MIINPEQAIDAIAKYPSNPSRGENCEISASASSWT